jgi:multiple sugar transport system substrate-binding protein
VTSGRPPDAVALPSVGQLPAYCATGVLVDLAPLEQAAGLPASAFPQSTQSFTDFGGLTCGLPVATRAYGLLADSELTGLAGVTRPPRTWGRLSADVLALTMRGADGSIEQAGLIPWQGYRGFSIGTVAVMFGGHWLDSSGHADLAGQAAWTHALMWQRRMLAALGLPAVEAFVASPGDPLGQGRQALAFGALGQASADGSAGRDVYWPAPAGDGMPYGAGRIGGWVLGIPRGSGHQAEAFALIRYLATDPSAQQGLAAALGGLPGSRAQLAAERSTASPSQLSAINQVTQSHSLLSPQLSLAGTGYARLVADFDRRWQLGDIPTAGLQPALARLDQQIDQQLALVTQRP